MGEIAAPLHGHAGNCANTTRWLQCSIDLWGIYTTVSNIVAEGTAQHTEKCQGFHEHNGLKQATLSIGSDKDLYARISENSIGY